MSKEYTKGEIHKMVEAATEKMPFFYRKGFINFIGTTSDTKEHYTEVVAEWLMGHFAFLEGIPTITRTESYKSPYHNGFIDIEHSQREEDRIAKMIFSQKKLPILGNILDYQTPLKNIQSDDAGKIDLLAYDGSVLRILELKRPDSNETMLRCVLEGYTYFKTVDVPKLLQDFGLPAETEVRVSPLVFHDRYQHREMKQERPQLKALMERLGIVPYYVHNHYRVSGE